MASDLTTSPGERQNMDMAEHQTIEYKQIWKDEYLKWICGFANAQGGKLYIGKNDRGEVTGLANTFFRSGYIESWGRGIEKIQRECREHDIPIPQFDFSMSGLMLTFQANPMRLKEALGETTQATSEKTSEKILGLVGENAHITIAELASAIGVTGRSIERNFKNCNSMES